MKVEKVLYNIDVGDMKAYGPPNVNWLLYNSQKIIKSKLERMPVKAGIFFLQKITKGGCKNRNCII